MDSKPQEFPEETLKAHFQGVHLQIVLLASGEYFPQFIYMVALFLRLYNDGIYVILDAITKQIMNNDSHGMLVGGTSVLKTERHDCVMEIAIRVWKAVFSASETSILI